MQKDKQREIDHRTKNSFQFKLIDGLASLSVVPEKTDEKSNKIHPIMNYRMGMCYCKSI